MTDARNTMGGVAHRNMHLQAMRGIAACMVMIYHAAHFTAQKTGAAWLEEVFSGRLGFYGVLTFFVLSGFLMESAVRRYDAKTFLTHRFIRLFPTYWGLFLAFYIVQSLRAGQLEAIPWSALTLLPLGEMYRPLHVEWTLLYEVFFYAVCALLCFWRRAHLAIHVVWLGIVAIAVFRFGQYGTTLQPTLAEIPFSVWNVGFIAGALTGHVARHVRQIRAEIWLLVGFVLVCLGELLPAGPRLFLASPGLACVVLAIVTPKPSSSSSPGTLLRIFNQLGECSYGLYLAHSLAIQIVLQYVPKERFDEPVAVFFGMIGVGLAVGLPAGLFDSVLYRSLKTFIDRRYAKSIAQRFSRELPNATTTGLPEQTAACGSSQAE